MKWWRIGAVASSALTLQACAAYHSVPPQNYSQALDGTLEKIVFDQDGDPYPRSDDPTGLALPQQPANKNRTFTLSRHFAGLGLPYDREKILDASAQRIVQGMQAAEADRVVFLIKGFNNSYERSDKEYEWLRQSVIGNRKTNGVYFVQVYWDALYRAKGTAPAPLAYFADSMTYSNHAGDCGLRSLLRRMPAGTNVTFLTHSRGAAVALAALSDADYDAGISNRCRSSTSAHAIPRQLGDVRLVAFAPAVGDGHLRDKAELKASLFSHLDRIYAGFNPNDPAVTKSVGLGLKIPARFGGDTRLGGSPSYVQHIADLTVKAGLAQAFQSVRFSRKSHAWPDYMALTNEADCMIWAGYIVKTAPPQCNLQR